LNTNESFHSNIVVNRLYQSHQGNKGVNMPISTQQDIYKTVKERQAEFAALYARMDGDKAGYCAGVVVLEDC
jgi:hypothetical protein